MDKVETKHILVTGEDAEIVSQYHILTEAIKRRDAEMIWSKWRKNIEPRMRPESAARWSSEPTTRSGPAALTQRSCTVS